MAEDEAVGKLLPLQVLRGCCKLCLGASQYFGAQEQGLDTESVDTDDSDEELSCSLSYLITEA